MQLHGARQERNDGLPRYGGIFWVDLIKPTHKSLHSRHEDETEETMG